MKTWHSLLPLLVAGAGALPTGIIHDLESRAIDTTLYNKFMFYSQYAAAAYCPSNNNSPNTKVTCSAGNCPLVQAADVTTISEFQNTFLTGTSGFLAIDNTNKLIVLSFRGTNSVRNFLADLDFALVPTDICTLCLAHNGFWKAWNEARAIVYPQIVAARAANPTYSVVATGHSLGGAISALAAADLRKKGIPTALYTYGQPRVGNRILSDLITAQAGGNYRITHRDDPVPRLPPLVFGYQHISPEYWISKGDTVVSPTDINVYTGGINFQGNTGTLGFNTTAHSYYFGRIGACGPPLELER